MHPKWAQLQRIDSGARLQAGSSTTQKLDAQQRQRIVGFSKAAPFSRTIELFLSYLKVGEAAREKTAQSGRIPRIAKLVALASRMQSMIESGQGDSFQQLAELGRISQPRMTQIMSLLHLAPDIQEELLYLPEVIQGKSTIHERLLRPLTREMDWRVQRRMWGRIKASLL